MTLVWTEILQVVAGLLVLGGAGFCLVAALGILRLQDVLVRMHASSKAGTLGCGMILLAVALFFPDLGTITRAIAAIAFLVISTPISAHMIGRAAYASGLRLWEGTVVDELRGRFDMPATVRRDAAIADRAEADRSAAQDGVG